MSERRIAILIGNSKFPKERKLSDLLLPGCDVDGLKEVLESELCRFSEVKTLKDEEARVVSLSIAETLVSAKEDDLVLIYYSGHGKVGSDGRLFLATSDTVIAYLPETSLVVEHLTKRLNSAISKKKLLILDCCYSGAVADALYRSEDPADTELERVSTLEGMCVLTASTDLQTAIEKVGDRYSLMTKHIIDGIRERKAIDNLGIISVAGIYEYIKTKVREEGAQTPTIHSRNINPADLIIAGGASPEKLQRKRIIEKLASLFSQMDPQVNVEAYQLIQTNSNSTREQREKLSLLVNLSDDELSPRDFESRWREIDASQKRVANYFDAAEAAEERENWDEAERRLQDIIAIDPDHAEATTRLKGIERHRALAEKYIEAQSFLHLGKLNDALVRLQSLESLRPNYRDVPNLISRVQSELASLSQVAAERKRLADEAQATKRRQEEIAGLYQEGCTFFDAGQWGKALDRFRRVQQLNNNYEQVGTYIRDSQVLQEAKAAEAETRLEVVAGIRSKLRELSVRESNVAKVADYLRDINARIERGLRSRYKEGQQLYEQRDWDGALERFEIIRSLDPDYMNIAQLIERVNQLKFNQGSSNGTRTGSQVSPIPSAENLAGANRLYAEARQDLRKSAWDAAIDKLEAALRLHPSSADIGSKLRMAKEQQELAGFYSAGQSQLAAKDWKAALNSFSRVITIDPDYKEVKGLLELARHKGKIPIPKRIFNPAKRAFPFISAAAGILVFGFLLIMLVMISPNSSNTNKSPRSQSEYGRLNIVPTPYRNSTEEIIADLNRKSREQELGKGPQVRIKVHVRGRSGAANSSPLQGAEVVIKFDVFVGPITRTTDTQGVAVAEEVPCGRDIFIDVTAEGMSNQSKNIYLRCNPKISDVYLTLNASK